MQVEIQYTATSTGGAQLLINGLTQSGWKTTGNYTRTANLQRLQLWNDGPNQLEFDDVRIAGPTPTGATVPGAPTGVAGTARDHAVDLTWTAPSSNGGSAISGYVVTPFIGATAQTPTVLNYATTSATIGGLTNGTAYTFRVAAVNGVGTGPASTASAALTPSGATLPGAPTGVVGTPRDASAMVAWTAPASDGGSPISGYVVTPYVGGVAGAPVLTGSHDDLVPRAGADERHRVHVHGRRDQRRRHRRGLRAVGRRHAASWPCPSTRTSSSPTGSSPAASRTGTARRAPARRPSCRRRRMPARTAPASPTLETQYEYMFKGLPAAL